MAFSGPGQRVNQPIFSAKRLFLDTRIYNRKEDSGPTCARATCAGVGHARPKRRCNTQNHDTPPHKHTQALPTNTSTYSNNTTHTRVQATVLPRALQKQLLALARDQLETWCYSSTSSLFAILDPSADKLLASESLLEVEHVSSPPCMHKNTSHPWHLLCVCPYVSMSVCLHVCRRVCGGRLSYRTGSRPLLQLLRRGRRTYCPSLFILRNISRGKKIVPHT
jgi:hypothetical protein